MRAKFELLNWSPFSQKIPFSLTLFPCKKKKTSYEATTISMDIANKQRLESAPSWLDDNIMVEMQEMKWDYSAEDRLPRSDMT